MNRNQKNLLILLVLILVSYLYSYRTTYDEFDNSLILDGLESNMKSNQEILIFDSKNPFNFYDIINNIDNVSNQTVYGILTYPEIKKESYPLVIGVAGSLGWGEHHYKYLNEYQKLGIATLALHSFNSRGVESTVGEQISVTIPMVVHDSYMALKALSKNKKIDINKVGITGWSLGGGVALFTAWMPIKDAISPNLKFAAHLPFYPPCVAKPQIAEFSDSPLHILAGEMDNWVPSEPCNELVSDLNNNGYDNAGITIYKNSHHSFDRKSDIKIVESAYRLEECSLLLDSNGIVSTNTAISIPMKNGFMQKLGLMLCAEKGPTMGGNDYARESSLLFSKDFMQKHLLSSNQ